MTFEKVLGARRIIYVTGSLSAGRASVAGAAALALTRRAPTLLVDADDPVHGLGYTLGSELPIATPKRLQTPWADAKPLIATRLSGTSTRAYLSELLAADKWRQLLEAESGSRIMSTFGLPLGDLADVLGCVQPPPGAEMPVALATLLDSVDAHRAKHVVVDAGTTVSTMQLQNVPQAGAQGLNGLMKLQQLLQGSGNLGAVPAAVAMGFRLVVSQRETMGAQFSEMMEGIAKLSNSMSSLASAEKTVLLVLPYQPGHAGEQAACRMIERLDPGCIALTGYREGDAHCAPRPSWLPPGPVAVTLPWGQERPSGIDELSQVAEAMLE